MSQLAIHPQTSSNGLRTDNNGKWNSCGPCFYCTQLQRKRFLNTVSRQTRPARRQKRFNTNRIDPFCVSSKQINVNQPQNTNHPFKLTCVLGEGTRIDWMNILIWYSWRHHVGLIWHIFHAKKLCCVYTCFAVHQAMLKGICMILSSQ